jgi:uncharacterized secreted protein with C-terminal beta-propeller domain
MTGKMRRLGTLLIFTASILAACGGQNSSSDEDPTGDEQPEQTPPPETTDRQSLSSAQDCSDLRERIVKAKTEAFIESRYLSNPPGGGRDDADGGNGGNSGAPSRSPNDYTETNNQVDGVDEADIVKTDGDYIYGVRDGTFLILKSWPPEETKIVAEYDLDNANVSPSSSSGGKKGSAYDGIEELEAKSLFLKDDKVAVFSEIVDKSRKSKSQVFDGTRISLLDVSTPSAPTLLKQISLEGEMLSGRMIDGDVYVVSNGDVDLPSDNRHGLSFSGPDNIEKRIPPRAEPDTSESERKRRAAIARGVVRSELRDLLSGVSIEGLLPQKRTFDDKPALTDTENLYACTDVYLPPNITELGLLGVSHFDLTESAGDIEITTTGLMASGWKMYASKENLYLALSNRSWRWGSTADFESSTHIHKFGLTGQDGRPEYRASGRVDGWVLNQFSMSEHDDHLRVATTDNELEVDPQTGDREETGGNHLIILEEDGDRLKETGSVRDMAPGERIYSVRMMGDKGYIVTFKQVDPLFTLDLSDPKAPKVKGELKINGFSTYMHPLGDDHLMTIGRAGTAQGNIQGIQLQIFDVSDMTSPKRIHKETISTGEWSAHSEAMWEHHAFTYHPDKDMLAFPLNVRDWARINGDNFSGLMIYKANAKDGFEEIGRVAHSDMLANRSRWWTRIRRSIFIEDYVYSYGEAGMKVNELMSPGNEMASVGF